MKIWVDLDMAICYVDVSSLPERLAKSVELKLEDMNWKSKLTLLIIFSDGGHKA